jgi:hypothetical protein
MEETRALLAPAAVLVLWTTIMVGWLAAARFSAVAKLKGQMPQVPNGARGSDIDPHLPDRAAWPSHNYTHLLEQPTIFYAVVIMLAIADGANETNLALAWGYTLLRIVHSIWQSLVNKLPVRFALFLASTICLIALAVNAVRLTL